MSFFWELLARFELATGSREIFDSPGPLGPHDWIALRAEDEVASFALQKRKNSEVVTSEFFGAASQI